jgi:hypothetical protein
VWGQLIHKVPERELLGSRFVFSRCSRVYERFELVRIASNAQSGAVIRVYDDTGNVIETHEHKGDFKEP